MNKKVAQIKINEIEDMQDFVVFLSQGFAIICLIIANIINYYLIYIHNELLSRLQVIINYFIVCFIIMIIYI